MGRSPRWGKPIIMTDHGHTHTSFQLPWCEYDENGVFVKTIERNIRGELRNDAKWIREEKMGLYPAPKPPSPPPDKSLIPEDMRKRDIALLAEIAQIKALNQNNMGSMNRRVVYVDVGRLPLDCVEDLCFTWDILSKFIKMMARFLFYFSKDSKNKRIELRYEKSMQEYNKMIEEDLDDFQKRIGEEYEIY
jgi:hypothetical protein